MCARSVISCARPSSSHPRRHPIHSASSVRLSPLSRRLRLATLFSVRVLFSSRALTLSLLVPLSLSFSPSRSPARARFLCLGIVQLKCRNCPSEFILKFVPNQSEYRIDVYSTPFLECTRCTRVVRAHETSTCVRASKRFSLNIHKNIAYRCATRVIARIAITIAYADLRGIQAPTITLAGVCNDYRDVIPPA